MSALEIAGQGLLVLAVMCALVLACFGLRDVRARRRAWEEYERRREAIENGTRLGNTRVKR